MDLRHAIQTPLFSPQRVCYLCRFTFPFLFIFICVCVCVCVYSEHEWGGVLSTHERGSCQPLSSAFRLALSFQWMWKGFDDDLSFFKKKSLNTCILSYVIETFIMTDSFWGNILYGCFIHELLFLQKFCGFLFHFPQLNTPWIFFCSIHPYTGSVISEMWVHVVGLEHSGL